MATWSTQPATVPKYKLMMVGKTGAGKSSFGNFILGRESFETGGGIEIVTAKAAADWVTVEREELYIVDTAGFGDPWSTQDDDDEVGLEEMARGLQLAVDDNDPGVDMILYVVSASERFTNEQRKAIEAIKGRDFWSYVLIVFTNADRVRNPDKHQYIQGLLKSARCPPALKEMMEEVEGRYMIVNSLDGTEAYRTEQVCTLLRNLRSMKVNNKSQRYRNELFDDILARYKRLKIRSREQSENMSVLEQKLSEMQASYTHLIQGYEIRIQAEKEAAVQQGKSMLEMQKSIAVLAEEKRRKQKEEQDKVGHLQKEIQQLKASYNEEAAEKQALKETVQQLKLALVEQECDRPHLCPLL